MRTIISILAIAIAIFQANYVLATPVGYYAQIIPTQGNYWFQFVDYQDGGEGVAYHDKNGDPNDSTNYEMTTNCNAAYEISSENYSVRNGECVDVAGCYGLNGSNVDYSLINIEAGEWIKYNVEVQEAGYYKIEYLSSPLTKGEISFSIGKYPSSFEYLTSAYYDTIGVEDLGNCLYTEGTEERVASIVLDSCNRDCADRWWECWEIDTVVNQEQNPTLLFKEPGFYVLKIFFETDGGNLGPFRFTKSSPYFGSSTAVVSASESQFKVYPNPTRGEVSVSFDDVAEVGVDIINTLGQSLYSARVKSGETFSPNLPKGTYILNVKSYNKVQQTKLIIE